MAKKFPNLQVVNKDNSLLHVSGENGESDSALPFLDIVNVSTLSQAERKKVERIVQNVSPNAEIVGAAVPGRAYDIRPVVIPADSSERALSLIRFFGPEAALISSLNKQVDSVLKRFLNSSPLPTTLVSVGMLDGQIWYQRSLVPETLSQRLQSGPKLSFEEALSIAKGLLEVVRGWHERGLLHGHITTANIFVTPEGEVGLLDPLVGLTVLQAGAQLGTDELAKDYDLSFFAPECLSKEWPGLEVDIYGCGKVFWELFSRVPRGDSTSDGRTSLSPEGLKSVRQLILQMTNEDPAARLTANQSLQSLFQNFATSSQVRAVSKENEKVEPKVNAPVVERLQEAVREPSAARSENPRGEMGRGEEKVVKDSEQREIRRRELAPTVTIGRNGVIPSGKFAVKSRIVRPAGQSAAGQGSEAQSHAAPEFSPAEVAAPLSASAHEKSATLQADHAGAVAGDMREVDFGSYLSAQKRPEKREALKSAVVSSAKPKKGVSEVVFSLDEEESAPAPKKAESKRAPLEEQFVPTLPQESPELDREFFEGTPAGSDEFVADQENSESDLLSEQELESENRDSYGRASFTAGVLKSLSQISPKGFVGIFAVLAILGFVFLRGGSSEDNRTFSKQDLLESWSSARKSEMVVVAELAVDPSEPSKAAQDVIIDSAREGDKASKVLGAGAQLLQGAFHDRWEATLTPEDRRHALLFALMSSGLVGDEALKNQKPLNQLHPGVLLALAASANDSGAEALASIPAEAFTHLPAPVGPAFLELLAENPDRSVADREVRMLSRFALRGIISIEDLIRYLNSGSQHALASLVTLVGDDTAASEQLLEKLLNHPNASFDGAVFAWARGSKLREWSELDSADKLGLLVGRSASHEPALPNVTSLLAHPAPQVRAYAIGQTIERIQLNHPAALEVLSAIKENPTILDGMQTYGLAAILQKPERITGELARKWISSGVPVKLLEMLLVSTVGAKEGSRVDFELARALQSAQWEPSTDVIEVLSGHPATLARVLAYSKAFALKDKNEARRILDAALAREQLPNLQQQLEDLLRVLQ